MPISYGLFVDVVAKVLLVLAALAGVVCLVDWAIRERKVSPFSAIARFFRRWIDPMMRPVESQIVRMGGQPASAPLWSFMFVVVAGILLLQVLRIFGGLWMEASMAFGHPAMFAGVLIGWAFRYLMFALIWRVVASWLPLSPLSPWIRWSIVSTEWLIAPLRRVIPTIGPFDITPLVAYFILALVRSMLGA